MIIQSSNISMSSERTYRMYSSDFVSYSSWGNRSNQTAIAATTLPTATDSEYKTETKQRNDFVKDKLKELEAEEKVSKSRIKSISIPEDYKGVDKVKYHAFRSLLELLMGVKEKKNGTDWVQEFQNLADQRREFYLQQLSGATLSQIRPTQAFGYKITESHYFEETEQTTFASSGSVVTADGEQIEFNIETEMSRNFQQMNTSTIDYEAAYMIDPLVINLDADAAQVSDQKFLFDLDVDGDLDNISLLNEACGFLSMDKNQDGIINDGKELFGTATGNGFEELAVFDMDKNGWIDENDDIFNKLRIWTKDKDGKDQLIALGVAGVGAIYLGNVGTKFRITSDSSQQTLGQVSRTGVYLKESGEVGTIQHVDLAVQ